jgi:hypothetical protein
MKIRNQNAAAAGVLYLIWGAFCVGVILVWTLTPPRYTVGELLSPPGATLLFFTIVFLFLSSAILGGLLLLQQRATYAVLGLGGVLACVGFSWNVVAGVFWLSPLFFVWRAAREAAAP